MFNKVILKICITCGNTHQVHWRDVGVIYPNDTSMYPANRCLLRCSVRKWCRQCMFGDVRCKVRLCVIQNTWHHIAAMHLTCVDPHCHNGMVGAGPYTLDFFFFCLFVDTIGSKRISFQGNFHLGVIGTPNTFIYPRLSLCIYQASLFGN